MRTWMEYCQNIEEYYDWISQENMNLIENLCVMSFNASGIEARWDEFYQYCTNQIFYVLNKPEEYRVYLIANEKIKNRSSKLEHYKKCWKTISLKHDISKLELGEEILYESNDNLFYAGIASTSLHNLADVLKIVSFKANKYIVFIGRNGIQKETYMTADCIKKYLVFDRYGDVDYSNCFYQSYLRGDISVRYGSSFTEAELALVFSQHEYSTIISAI